jgi:hypothetical protein
MERERDPNYDIASFRILAYEFDGDDHADAEIKIKRKLKRDNLGAYDQMRIDYLRSLKDELQNEIGLFGESRYFIGPVGPLAALADFDSRQMLADYGRKYAEIKQNDLAGFIGFALYLYYLR